MASIIDDFITKNKNYLKKQQEPIEERIFVNKERYQKEMIQKHKSIQ